MTVDCLRAITSLQALQGSRVGLQPVGGRYSLPASSM